MTSLSEIGAAGEDSLGTGQPRPTVEAPQLRLYIARATPNSVRAEQNLSAVLASLGADRASLVPEIIDVFANGKRAVNDGVIVTPTFVVVRGDKRYTLVGDLSDASQLRALLE
jgi:KaiB domain